MRKNKLAYHIGNILIIVSLIGFGVTFYPLISAYFPRSYANEQSSDGNAISIPKIKANSPIIENVDPFNKLEYDEALKQGVAHAKSTASPGQAGTVFLFAHSSALPWELTRVNAVFLRLGELKNGDIINIVQNGKKYTYEVTDKKVVWPNEVNYLLNTSKTQLILQTCTPIGTSLKRLLIFATMQHSKPDVPTHTTSGV